MIPVTFRNLPLDLEEHHRIERPPAGKPSAKISVEKIPMDERIRLLPVHRRRFRLAIQPPGWCSVRDSRDEIPDCALIG